MLEVVPFTHGDVTLNVRKGAYHAWDTGILKEVHKEYLWDRLRYPDIHYACDVGAHIGAWTRTLKQRAPHAQVIAVEPMAENALMLAVNCHLVHQVYQYHAAVQYTDEPRMLLVHRENSGGAVLVSESEALAYADNPDWTVQPVAQIVTLEELTLRHAFPHLDVLKIDCEGGERNVLAECSEDLLRATRTIIGEHHGTIDVIEQAFMSRLRDLFDVEYIPHPNPNVHDLGMFFAVQREGVFKPLDIADEDVPDLVIPEPPPKPTRTRKTRTTPARQKRK